MFSSPLPNPLLWNGSTIGYLQTYEGFANGGWWHDQNILSETGEGADIEGSDEALCRAITEKFKSAGGNRVRYADIAKRSWEVGRPGLATKV